MKAIKPTSLGLLHKPYRFRHEDRLVVVALGFFRLGGDATSLLAEQNAWPEIVQRLPAEQPLDMLMPKSRAEVLATATAYAAQPVTEMAVRLQVGTIDKRLRVVGNRQWYYSTMPLHGITAPQPFTSMPIDYSRAYGGAQHPGNPTGCGHTGRRFGTLFGDNSGPMPNIEYLAQPVTGHYRPLNPAGFGALDVRWDPRRQMTGTYDQRWLDEQAPGLPLDIDWQVFNAAPIDQQMPQFLQGGEAYRLEGLHPEHSVITGRLPDFRIRALLQKKNTPSTEEMTMVFDTVWFFPDAMLGVALFRGEMKIADSEAFDVDAALLAYERRSDVPRSLEHYRQALALRLGTGKEALIHLLNESPLRPIPDADSRARLAAEVRDEEATLLAKTQARIDAIVTEMGDCLPEGFVAPKAERPAFGILPQAAISRGEADLSELFSRLDARVAEIKTTGEANMAVLAAEQQKLRAGADVVEPSTTDDNADAAVARVHGRHYLERAELLSSAPTASGESDAKAVEALAKQSSELDQQGRRAAHEPVPLALSPAAAKALGMEVRRLLTAGQSLSGRDLAGADLAGIDLVGADLKNVMLERADLSGAQLRGADLRGAVLTGAILTGAQLDDACLDDASLNRASAKGASFKRAKANKLSSFNADFAKADFSSARIESWLAVGSDLTAACLDYAELPSALLLEISAVDSHWRGAQLQNAVLIRANLVRADFSQAQLTRCAFANALASQAIFRGAKIDNCFFGDADLSAADLSTATASQSSWRKGKLSGARLSEGRFGQCDFGEADLRLGNLDHALFKGSILSRARLEQCSAREVNWFQSQCRKTDLRRADLFASAFMQADLNEALFAAAELGEARHMPLLVDTQTDPAEEVTA